MKKRKLFFTIAELLKMEEYRVIIIVGLRKTGKTTILKQLEDEFNGHYVDFRSKGNPDDKYEDALEHESNLLLLDEVGYLPAFDYRLGGLDAAAGQRNKKAVITSSSYGAMKQLSSETLGGGRSCIVELFPLSFEEYLYFTDRIEEYGQDYIPSKQDLSDYYRLEGVPPGMNFIIDKKYMTDTFNDAEEARKNLESNERDIYLESAHYEKAVDIIAYTLNTHLALRKFGGTKIGTREFTSLKGIKMSETLIHLANQITHGLVDKEVGALRIPALARIIKYLYHNGFLFVDLKMTEDSEQSADMVLPDFNLVHSAVDFEQVLSRYEFSVISPLIYTRLLVDMEGIAGRLYDNPSLDGELLELTIKAESVQNEGYRRNHWSYKYKSDEAEVDLYNNGLLLEATVRKKSSDEFYVDKVLVDKKLIRVLTREDDYHTEYTGVYHKIPYPLAVLKLSNRTICNLKSSYGVR